MGLKRREYTKEFKLQVITEVEAGKPMSQVGREHQVNATTIAKWRKQLRQYKDKAFAGNGHAYSDEARTAELQARKRRPLRNHPLCRLYRPQAVFAYFGEDEQSFRAA